MQTINQKELAPSECTTPALEGGGSQTCTTATWGVNEVVACLTCTRETGVGQWMACCPAHDDHNPSLSIKERPDGRVLLHCFAGCKDHDIWAKLEDLRAVGGEKATCQPAQADGTQQPVASRSVVVGEYDYSDENGELLFQVVRMEPKGFRQRRSNGNGGWIWDLKGVRRVLYRLQEVTRAAKEGQLVAVVEGEKDVEALCFLGFAATCNPGGAGKWQPEFSEALAGAAVVVVSDKDEPGRQHATKVATSILGTAASVKVVELPDRNDRSVKDAADWVAAGGTRKEFEQMVAAMDEWKILAQPADMDGTALRDPLAAAREGKPFACTDLGNAERFAYRHTGKALHSPGRGWMVWDRRRWRPDPSGREVLRMAEIVARKIGDEAAVAPRPENKGEPDLRDLLFAHAKKSEGRRALDNIVALAMTMPGIKAQDEDFDVNPFLLTCANGTIDLRTGRLRRHDPDDRITQGAPVAYDPGVEGSEAWRQWLQFLDDSTGGDQEFVAFLQRAAGYTLTADVSEEVLFFVHGPEAAGKSTFLSALQTALGDCGVTIGFDTLLKRRGGDGGARNDIARLAGKRLVASSEVEDGRQMAEELVKSLTGGDIVTARFLYREFFDFAFSGKLWLVANHAPRVNEDDGAMWRRILRLPFIRIVPPEKRVLKLKKMLKDPKVGGPVVLWWAVQGCLAWQRDGLQPPKAIVEATRAYREECDPITPFLQDRCVLGSDLQAQTGALKQAYQSWAADEGVRPHLRLGDRAFAAKLRERGCASFKATGGVRMWRGIAMADAEGNLKLRVAPVADSGAILGNLPSAPAQRNFPELVPLAPLAPLSQPAEGKVPTEMEEIRI